MTPVLLLGGAVWGLQVCAGMTITVEVQAVERRRVVEPSDQWASGSREVVCVCNAVCVWWLGLGIRQ